MKNSNNASRNLVQYIRKSGLSVFQIEKDTGISKERLSDENANFLATEFLTLCSYLHLKPEDMT